MVESSRRNTDFVAGLIHQKTEILDKLVMIMLQDEGALSWKAAWAIDIATEKRPDLLEPHLKTLVEKLGSVKQEGTKRQLLRMLSRSPLPAESLGQMISICFDCLTTAREAVAVKMFSMEILYRISCLEPGLKKELADSIEWRMEEETPGFRSHGRKLLKKLYREMQAM